MRNKTIVWIQVIEKTRRQWPSVSIRAESVPDSKKFRCHEHACSTSRRSRSSTADTGVSEGSSVQRSGTCEGDHRDALARCFDRAQKLAI